VYLKHAPKSGAHVAIRETSKECEMICFDVREWESSTQLVWTLVPPKRLCWMLRASPAGGVQKTRGSTPKKKPNAQPKTKHVASPAASAGAAGAAAPAAGTAVAIAAAAAGPRTRGAKRCASSLAGTLSRARSRAGRSVVLPRMAGTLSSLPSVCLGSRRRSNPKGRAHSR
jgi:hypothetical protein